MKRILTIFVAVSLVVTIPFLLWGDSFDALLDGQGSHDLLRSWGTVAWLAAILLLVGDILLPIPATAVMGALGAIYGPVTGGLVGTLGSCLAGLTGYFLCRRYGRGIAVRIAGEDEMAKAERFFARSGGFAVAVSRWMPVLPEAIACMAGLAGMNARRFSIALFCGSAPMAFVYSTIGGHIANPVLAITICALLPVVLWLGLRRLVPEESAAAKPQDAETRLQGRS